MNSFDRHVEVARFNFPRLLIPQSSPMLPAIPLSQTGIVRAPVALLNHGSAWARLPTSRKIDNIRSGKMISDVYSFKMGLHVRCESTLERDAAILLDWAPAVASFRSQPPKLAYEHDGKLRHTTPDFGVQIYGGFRPGLIEVKPEPIANRLDIISKSHAASRAAERLDLHYGYLTCRDIRNEPRLSNVKRLRRYATVPVSPELLSLVAEKSWNWTRLGALRRAVAVRGFDHLPLFALMYWGVLKFDIQEPFDDSLVVRYAGVRHAE